MKIYDPSLSSVYLSGTTFPVFVLLTIVPMKYGRFVISTLRTLYLKVKRIFRMNLISDFIDANILVFIESRLRTYKLLTFQLEHLLFLLLFELQDNRLNYQVEQQLLIFQPFKLIKISFYWDNSSIEIRIKITNNHS